MSKDPAKTNMFIDRESGQAVRVERVDSAYAYVTVMKALPSKWGMPVADYDSEFVRRYLPLDAGDMAMPPEYRPPANASEWDAELAPPLDHDPERSETPEGVRIGAAGASGEGPFGWG